MLRKHISQMQSNSGCFQPRVTKTRKMHQPTAPCLTWILKHVLALRWFYYDCFPEMKHGVPMRAGRPLIYHHLSWFCRWSQHEKYINTCIDLQFKFIYELIYRDFRLPCQMTPEGSFFNLRTSRLSSVALVVHLRSLLAAVAIYHQSRVKFEGAPAKRWRFAGALDHQKGCTCVI